MSAMLARVSDAGSYQALQHFITDAPWSADGIWRRLRQHVPAREGVLIFDGTSFPKQGTHSVGVGRQYCGALGKIANCQVATTAALWTGTQAWLLGAQLYLPKTWLTPAARVRGRIPATVRFQEKWRHALTLLRQCARPAFGSPPCSATRNSATTPRSGRRCIARASRMLSASRRRSACSSGRLSSSLRSRRWAGKAGRTRDRRCRRASPHSRSPPKWRRGRRGAGRRSRGRTRRPAASGGARFAALRVTPAHAWRQRRLAPEVWLLAERDLGTTPRTKYYLVHLPATTALDDLVHLAHQRWAIEQQYHELKDELGFDHFEGRSWPGWQRHAALIAVAYTFLQVERQRGPSRDLTLPRVRAIIQEVLTAHFFVTRPHYLTRMLKLQDVVLRI